MKNPVIIFGAGQLGKTALSIFNENNILLYGFLDDKEELNGKEIGQVMVLGKTSEEELLSLIGKKTEAFVAIRNASDRKTITESLKKKRKAVPVNAIHPSAKLAEEASIGHGNLVAANASIGPFSEIGNSNILGPNSVLDTETKIGNFVEIGSGALINSGVEIEDGAFVGSGAVLVSGIKIGKNARIGAGSVVIADVKANETLFGNPAKPLPQ
ncbi:acetyltransferase [Marinilongibacter aquaticus]|uniref:acetyltransferase n=1 Tax=Marinilongibacter aquaticus TaxID=2975157 RepID=UPI0021BDCD1B|nr:acetyltransferase [Marinilongibacter aquaticus]UBM57569.1 acetyltransferase [Marinilongibacter aquaticus]